MPVTDVMTGLQTDLLDSVTVPPVGAVVFQWHTRLKFISDVPLAYVYAALLINKRAFSRISPEDQKVIREVMEGIYRKFDQNGVRDNREALQALLDNGLEMVSPNAAEVAEWRNKVSDSQQVLAEDGVFDPELLRRLNRLVQEFRRSQAAAAGH